VAATNHTKYITGWRPVFTILQGSFVTVCIVGLCVDRRWAARPSLFWLVAATANWVDSEPTSSDEIIQIEEFKIKLGTVRYEQFLHAWNATVSLTAQRYPKDSAIVAGPRDALCHLKSWQLGHGVCDSVSTVYHYWNIKQDVVWKLRQFSAKFGAHACRGDPIGV